MSSWNSEPRAVPRYVGTPFICLRSTGSHGTCRGIQKLGLLGINSIQMTNWSIFMCPIYCTYSSQAIIPVQFAMTVESCFGSGLPQSFIPPKLNNLALIEQYYRGIIPQHNGRVRWDLHAFNSHACHSPMKEKWVQATACSLELQSAIQLNHKENALQFLLNAYCRFCTAI